MKNYKERNCGVNGCTDTAVATLHKKKNPDDNGHRSRDCLIFDLDL